MSRLLPATPEAISTAAAELRSGRLVAFPTETVYGLAADAANDAAVRRVFALKGRPASHPVIVHLAGAAALGDWAALGAAAAGTVARQLGQAFWPGPITLILPAAPGVSKVITGGQDTVAVRVPANAVALSLLAEFGGALVAPSANRHGRVSPTRAEHVVADFPDADLLVLDGGPCEVGLESTIVDLSGPRPRLLRPGGLSAERIEAVLGQPLQIVPAVSTDTPRAPGTLPSHYAPAAAAEWVAADSLTRAAARPGAAVLARSSPPPGHVGSWVTLPDDPTGYGKALYAALRELDAGKPVVILVEEVPAQGAWLAVHDRLRRATAVRPRQEPRPTEAAAPVRDASARAASEAELAGSRNQAEP